MSFLDAVQTCFSKFADFKGRARRSEYWYFCLFNIAVNVLLGILLGTESIILTIYSIVVLIPGLAVCARRLHDIGKSGWSLLMALIPFVGAIILIVWFCREGEAGTNAYGENPKGAYAGAQTAEYTPVYESPAEPEATAAEAYEAPSAQDDPFAKENIQANYGPKFCTACGAELKPGQKFCEYCGTKIG